MSNGDSICYDKLSSLDSDNILLMPHRVSFNLAPLLLLLMLHVFVSADDAQAIMHKIASIKKRMLRIVSRNEYKR